MSNERKTCATCRFLGEPDPLIDWDDESNIEVEANPNLELHSEHRLCTRIPDAGDGSGVRNFFDAAACVTDGSGYIAKLRVLPSFGCSLWEATP